MSGDRQQEFNTERVHQRPLSGMGRRRFVKTLVASGFGVASASRLSITDFANVDEQEVSIVYAVARDDPGDPTSISPRVRTVAANWYDDIRTALSTRDTLNLTEMDGVLNAYVVPGDYEGDTAASIGVDVRSEAVAEEVAELADEVPIESSIIETVDEGDEDVSIEREYDPDDGPEIPGGVAVGEAEGTATLAPALYDPEDDEWFFATANHLYTDAETDELAVLVDGKRHPIGRVRRRHAGEDLALISPTGEFEPSHVLDGSAPNRVVGQFSRIGLADLKARGAEIQKIGSISGHTTGRIQAIDGVTCVYGDPCKRGQLKWGNESGFTDGDSGSVSYYPDPENPHEQVLVCGMNNARTWWPSEDYIWGTGAYALHETYGYTF